MQRQRQRRFRPLSLYQTNYAPMASSANVGASSCTTVAVIDRPTMSEYCRLVAKYKTTAAQWLYSSAARRCIPLRHSFTGRYAIVLTTTERKKEEEERKHTRRCCTDRYCQLYVRFKAALLIACEGH